MNIDIHCHSSSKPVMKETNDPKNEDYLKQLLTGFTFGEDTPSRRKINSLVETVSGVYMNTQSHFDSLYEGDIRIACISLTPMEVGFNIINKDKNKIGLLNDLLRKLYTKKRSQYLISPKLINALTGYDLSSIEYVQDGMRDYYEGLLLKEYNYLMEFDNTTRTINNKTYTIRFPKNKTELNR
ncbi:MAG TPA: hypothetical protein PLU17_12805, partial [Chitinophagaceae bacterium]|nr:hypothetical protein [Chitinophagaceae bacterium]